MEISGYLGLCVVGDQPRTYSICLQQKLRKGSELMKSIYFLDQRPGFQTVMSDLRAIYVSLCAENPEPTKEISINTGRIIAAAIQAAQDADLRTLADLISYDIIPGKGFKDKDVYDEAAYKTVHLPLMMTDYLKAGAATLNIHILGPIEDESKIDPKKIEAHYRITARQYLHLAVIYLSGLTSNHQLISLVSSNVLYPFIIPGPKGPRKPVIAVDNTIKAKQGKA